MKYGLHRSRYALEDKVHKKKVQDIGGQIVLDAERCILCSRCVRFLQEVTGTGELEFFQRGDHSEISIFREGRSTTGTRGTSPTSARRGADQQGFPVQVPGLVPPRRQVDLPRLRQRLQRRGPLQGGYRLPPQAPAERRGQRTWMCDPGRLEFRKANEAGFHPPGPGERASPGGPGSGPGVAPGSGSGEKHGPGRSPSSLRPVLQRRALPCGSWPGKSWDTESDSPPGRRGGTPTTFSSRRTRTQTRGARPGISEDRFADIRSVAAGR